MVCRECGAYNAEHLTHCRVCSAKLRDDEPASAASSAASAPAAPVAEESGDRPVKGNVAAPSWPKSAFTGAPENKPLTSAPAPAAAAPAERIASTISRPAQQSAEPATRRACPHCGKATLADAPYCAYCGELLSAPAGTASRQKAAVSAAPLPAAQKKAVAKPSPSFGRDELDDEDYDDEDDYDEPVKRKKSKPVKKSRYADFDDEDDEDDEDEDDEDVEDDGRLASGDEDDEDYDDEDDDGTVYKKRGKGTTILFWGLIGLLLVVIVIFGKVIADRNFDGDVSKMFASIGSLISGKTPEADTAPSVDAEQTASPNMYTGTISLITDEKGDEYYAIDIYAPTGSTLRINSNAALDSNEATVPTNDHVILHVVPDAFLPNAPCDSATVTVTPDIQAITPEGETVQIDIPSITMTVPVLSLTLDEPTEATVQATFNNDPIVISGRVDDPTTEDDHTVEVYINGQQVEVYAGGQFSYTYTPTIAATTAADTTAATSAATDAAGTTTDAGTATDAGTDTSADTTGTAGGVGETVTGTDTAGDTTESAAEAASDDTQAAGDAAAAGTVPGETITIEARKSNCVTARTIITIEPYVIQSMALIVTNDAAAGLSASDGNVTVQGTVTPGATITLSCDSDKVTFGQPTVSATGNFSVAVTIAEVGPYSITLTATQVGYKETSTSAIVERPPTETYKKFMTGASDLAKILAKVTAGETTSGKVYATGTVTEVIGTSPYTIFRMKLSDGTEIVVCNRSAKSTINSSDIKQKKQIFGNLFGFYQDSTTPYVWAWFILNK